jgi:hypothetical protein
MAKPTPQDDFPTNPGEEFKLVGECGVDPDRVIRERQEAAAAAAAARKYELKMLRRFARCPGFLGGDMPSRDNSKGVVVIDPAMALEARDWLRRRCHINESIALSEQGLCIEVIPRVRKAQGPRQPAPSFAKPKQFTLAL